MIVGCLAAKKVSSPRLGAGTIRIWFVVDMLDSSARTRAFDVDDCMMGKAPAANGACLICACSISTRSGTVACGAGRDKVIRRGVFIG